MNGYVGFYKGRREEVHAETQFAAQTALAAKFKVKPKQQHQIAVVLAEKNGEQVTHTPDF